MMNRSAHHITILLALFLCSVSLLNAQKSNKALFLGNSYTAFNSLPQMVKDVALSAGDTLIVDSNTPGGYTLEAHSQNPRTQQKIRAGDWDYVVLQGQSREPLTNTSRFKQGALALCDQIKEHNDDAVVMPYMTWGRKNGDASNCKTIPAMCTYKGMDTKLRNEYLALTSSLDGEVASVSMVWSYLRQNHPTLELYDRDESHPSLAGSYAAACCFYTAIFKKDPTLITFDSELNTEDAAIIRRATKTTVYNNLRR